MKAIPFLLTLVVLGGCRGAARAPADASAPLEASQHVGAPPTPSWLDSLLVKNVAVDGGVFPLRGTINFQGPQFAGLDDPANNQITISLVDGSIGGGAGGGGTTLPDAGTNGIWYQNDAGLVKALAAGSSDNSFLRTHTAVGLAPDWATVSASTNLAFGKITTDVSTTSTTYADLLTQTITTSGTNLLIQWSLSGTQTQAGNKTAYGRILLDGVPVLGAGAFATAPGTFALSLANTFVVLGISNASHTVKLQWKTDPGGGIQCAVASDPDTESVNLLLVDLH